MNKLIKDGVRSKGFPQTWYPCFDETLMIDFNHNRPAGRCGAQRSCIIEFKLVV